MLISVFIGGATMRCATLVLLLLAILSWPVQAKEYYNKKWFDVPDLGTAPKITQTGCGKQACTKLPEVHGIKVSFKMKCACINPLMKTELLRKDVRVVVNGPDTADKAVEDAVVGYVAGCVVAATAASTAGPQIIASPAGFFAAFKACIATLSVSGVAGGILNQVDIHFDTSQTHWSPL
jgi:hypothetical protein